MTIAEWFGVRPSRPLVRQPQIVFGAKEAEPKFDHVFREVEQLLRGDGFSKSGKLFRKEKGGNYLLVGLQRSASNTRGNIKFTFNLGIVCPLIVDEEGSFADLAKLDFAQVRNRIGHVMPDMYDVWWTATSDTDEVSLAREIVGVIKDHALPWLESLSTAPQVLALWESGRSPGLTKGAWQEKLAALREVLSKQNKL